MILLVVIAELVSMGLIVHLPPELLSSLSLVLDDELTIEVMDGAIVLKPKRNTSPNLNPSPPSAT
jgi:antitoxin component of MazEF toxin-antitoxin module